MSQHLVPRPDPEDDDEPMTPAESLALLLSERARAERSLDVDPGPLYVGWGLAWLVGFTTFALHSGPDPVLTSPPVVPGLVLLVGLAAAGAVTAVNITRAQRGVAGDSATSGTLYGLSWLVGFTALSLLVNSTAAVLGDDRLHVVLWPAGSGLVVGLLYLSGGALWRDRTQYALGAWVALTSCAAPFLGLPGQHWVMALAGGGGFLVAAALTRRQQARAGGRAVRTTARSGG